MSDFHSVFIYLLVAVIAVPLAKRLGLGSVLGYLLAGVAIGPFALRLVTDPAGIMHFAEFGVIMMLFIIGLELRPSLLWQLRGNLFGMGGLQVGGTALAVMLGGYFCGLPWKPALAIGLILAMSSTAIVLQSLGEKGLLKTPGGEASFSILLFQDMAVIPILALMPLLATLPTMKSPTPGNQESMIESLQGWPKALVVLAAISFVVFVGRYLLRPFFRYIANTNLREMFTATTLLLVIGVVILMEKVGLSPALGTFLAGVLLAESEYRVQLETDIEPFKGLLLGLFFISVGASIDFALVASKPGVVAFVVLGLLLVKFLVLFGVGRLFKLNRSQSFLLAFALAQGGEFAFVLFSIATQQSVLSLELSHILAASVALSMAASPLLLLFNDKVVQPLFQLPSRTREPDIIDEHDNPVILAGFGRFGNIVGRLLRANGYGTTVLDHDADQVDALLRFGLKSFYGDASRLDLLRAAGADKARLFIVAIDDDAKANEIIQIVKQNFPHLRILARAVSRQHAYEILRLEVPDFFRDTLGSALDLGTVALSSLGMDEKSAIRAAQIFKLHDEAAVRDMAHINPDNEAYLSRARMHNENLKRALEADRETFREGNGQKA
ncbi:MAG: potassium transporter [Verrucomicrobiales bacterium]|nr:potassium transporter [Verrucomicrobiales bacterium]